MRRNLRGCFAFLMTALCMMLVNENQAQAQEVMNYGIHQDYVSVRALGMGNAFTALADDHSAMFYNPAAIARRESGVVHTYIRAGAALDWFDLFEDIDEASDDPNEVTAVTNVLEENYGNHYYLRAPSLGGFWVRPNWGIAFIPVDVSVDVAVHQQLGPQLNVEGYADSTLAFSYARDFNWLGSDHHLSAGVTAKLINRVYAAESVLAAQLINDSEVFDQSAAKEGLALDADVGFLFTPKLPESGFLSHLKYAKPTFSFVIRNLLDMGYVANLNLVSEESEDPPKLQRRFDVGSVWKLPSFWVFDPHLTFDVRDMGHPNWNIMKGLHLGAEFYWTMFNWWKGHWAAGINQGYWTAGVGMKMAVFQLDIASWGEEVGTSSAPHESRRYMLEMSLNF